MKELKVASPAKLNLYLKVIGKLPKGFHKIVTIFERINLCDKIIFKLSADGKIHISSNQKDLPLDKRNLVFQAAQSLKNKYHIKQGVNIFIEKNIPVASGLGGGSSNAASTLLGLNRLWKLGLTQKQLLKYAQRLGADVAFFITKTRFAIGLNRGDKIISLKRKKKLIHILIIPKIKIYARDIYAKFDQLSLKLTKRGQDAKILSYILKNKDFSLSKNIIYNELEKVTLKAYPIVQRAKTRLEDLGLDFVLMSGKGPAIFAIIKARKEAISLFNKLDKNTIGRIYLVETY
ncbi:MAG: 4-(cytidine 5'-diphospho)-2-C-methyl-D-erythritol kinase [Candidatus Omnitrophota bacterium]